MNDHATHKQLEEALAKNNKEMAKVIVDEISETMGVMMDRIDERFNRVEFRLDILEKEIKLLRLDTEDKFNRLTSTVDGFVKRLDDIEIEQTARDAKFDRLAKWAKEVSEKTGIPLPQL